MFLGKFQILVTLCLVKATRLAGREIKDEMERSQGVG